jgi:hypothetical protein
MTHIKSGKTPEQVKAELEAILFPSQPAAVKEDGTAKTPKELRKERRQVTIFF